MFVRFTVLSTDADTGRSTGVLVAGHILRDEGDLSVEEHRELRLCLQWFNDQLKVPSTSSTYTIQNRRALSWFKPGATEHIKRMWELKHILARHGLHVNVLKTREPGTVVYEDQWQLVAVPAKGQRFS
jgi:hypothetical protein